VNDIRLCLSIGDGDSFLNDADVDEDVNIAPVDFVSMKFVAVRDIQEGEELIYDVSF
jgi:SET domain-containing protein